MNTYPKQPYKSPAPPEGAELHSIRYNGLRIGDDVQVTDQKGNHHTLYTNCYIQYWSDNGRLCFFRAETPDYGYSTMIAREIDNKYEVILMIDGKRWTLEKITT